MDYVIRIDHWDVESLCLFRRRNICQGYGVLSIVRFESRKGRLRRMSYEETHISRSNVHFLRPLRELYEEAHLSDRPVELPRSLCHLLQD